MRGRRKGIVTPVAWATAHHRKGRWSVAVAECSGLGRVARAARVTVPEGKAPDHLNTEGITGGPADTQRNQHRAISSIRPSCNRLIAFSR